MYTAHALRDGFPGKSRTHGAFGWSSVWLLQDETRRVIVDTGPPAYIPVIDASLEKLGLTAADITDVLLTHLHWDHVCNLTMFTDATIWVGEEELAWAAELPPGTPYMPDLHVKELLRRATGVERMRDGQSILPGITTISTPGHTPGHLAFLAEAVGDDVIFAGDSVKNIYELSSLRVDQTMDEDASRRSVDRLKSLMRDTGALLAPGHDVLLRLDAGEVERRHPQRAQISFFATADGGEDDRSIF
jgi:glyoxylase-like metal-dependent hydrolase (beta-lactamase superfamily II)